MRISCDRNTYLNKEKKRWKLILGDDILVDSYLRVLSVACIVGIFNITDKEISKSVSTSKTTPITSKVLFKNQQ